MNGVTPGEWAEVRVCDTKVKLRRLIILFIVNIQFISDL